MAEDPNEKAKRVRELLSSFYRSDESDSAESTAAATAAMPGHTPGGRRDTLLAINTKDFNVDRYMSSLIRRTSLEGLLKKHVEMAAEIKNLDSDMQMLVYENYNKFISATDTIRRMKENVSGMETNMEQLLDKVTAVRTTSDGVNASLFERRERIEELNGTRSLLRKVQFVFDLPKRLRKCQKSEAYAEAVKYYMGALPILKVYGKTSFQACKEESEEVMAIITKRLQARVMTDLDPVQARAEAVRLLQKLNFPINKLVEGFLTSSLDHLLLALQTAAAKPKFALQETTENSTSELSAPHSPKELMENLEKDFIKDFAQVASTFRTIFPMGEKRLTEATKELFNKYFTSVQESLQPEAGLPSAAELVASLKILSADVKQMHAVLPEAGLPECAAKAVKSAVKQHVARIFSGLASRITGAIESLHWPTKGQSSDVQKPLQLALENIQHIIMQGSLDVLRDLKELLDDSVDLLVKWRDAYVDLVQGGFQDLFTSLIDEFLALPWRNGIERSGQDIHEKTASPLSRNAFVPGLMLLLARLSVYIEQIAVPKITEVVAASFIGGGAQGQERPAFVPSEICRAFRLTGEKLLRQARKLSLLVSKSVAAPNWLQYKEPRDVRMFVDLLFEEVEAIEAEVQQVLEPGIVRMHRRSDSTGSAGSTRSNTTREDRNSRSSISQRVRSRLLERDVAKLFKQRIEIFTKPEYTQVSVISTIIKMCLKSFQECVRLETFNRCGFQQIQLDTQYLRDPLRELVDDEAVVDFLLDEVSAAAAERCLDPIPLESAVVEKLILAKRAKASEFEGTSLQ
ncbi:hypothetical protein O6H91_10G049200 [Diphasiastrum complanatum]|uniref:Uncharacterized protein n=1 Tax=Diphasiastrum complanatum TaxID=34168 RepID=A0ACC2CGU4_DIPCM|nr:hypothetical protein O6H91_10G049200 [Diphasiastrum complanatum]